MCRIRQGKYAVVKNTAGYLSLTTSEDSSSETASTREDIGERHRARRQMIVAGTGHRPDKLGGYDDETLERLTDLARGYLDTLPDVKAVISGMALGWDMAIAYAAHQKSIPLWAYIPFDGQEKMWPQRSRDRYWDLRNAAEKVYVVCSGGYAPWKMQRRNERMVDECDFLLTLWNGTSGGTANCVRYANKVNRAMHNLWDRFQLIQCKPVRPPA
jgi:uncharacterized phage-like protein YoqJ